VHTKCRDSCVVRGGTLTVTLKAESWVLLRASRMDWSRVRVVLLTLTWSEIQCHPSSLMRVIVIVAETYPMETYSLSAADLKTVLVVAFNRHESLPRGG
jgi:hypothetical protein